MIANGVSSAEHSEPLAGEMIGQDPLRVPEPSRTFLLYRAAVVSPNLAGASANHRPRKMPTGPTPSFAAPANASTQLRTWHVLHKLGYPHGRHAFQGNPRPTRPKYAPPHEDEKRSYWNFAPKPGGNVTIPPTMTGAFTRLRCPIVTDPETRSARPHHSAGRITGSDPA